MFIETLHDVGLEEALEDLVLAQVDGTFSRHRIVCQELQNCRDFLHCDVFVEQFADDNPQSLPVLLLHQGGKTAAARQATAAVDKLHSKDEDF